jgi:hypothetical protein
MYKSKKDVTSLVEEGAPPHREMVDAYIERHGEEQLREKQRWMHEGAFY